MRKFLPRCVGFAALWGMTGGIFGQQADSPPLPAVSHLRIPENTSWSISRAETRSGELAGKTANNNRQDDWLFVEIVQYGALRHGIERFANGKTWEWWVRDGFLIHEDATGSGIVIEGVDKAASNSVEMSLAAPGFPGLQWLKEQYYRGKVQLQNRECSHFEAVISGQQAEAWIDVETSMPKRIRLGDTLFDIRFGAPPASAPELSPQALEKWDKMNALKARAAKIEQSGRR